MPVAGGILPAAGAQFNELNAITRRAFIPSLVVQQYQATPLLSALLAQANTASGGVSSVTVPVQGSSLVAAQAIGYDGSFAQPAELQGIQDAEFNLKAVVVPIPFLGMEGLVQMNAAVIPKIEAKMNDAGNVLAAYLAGKLCTGTAQNVDIQGLPYTVDATSTYGNIDRTTATWWQGANPTAPAANTAPTRLNMLQYIVAAMQANGGEMPSAALMSPGTWVALAQDFMGLEQYRITPDSSFADATSGAKSSFTALSVAGVPFFIEPGLPNGEVYFLNWNYFGFYIHEAASFAFTGFASTLPNYSLGYIGAVVTVLEDICVKPKSVCFVNNFSSVATT